VPAQAGTVLKGDLSFSEPAQTFIKATTKKFIGQINLENF